MSKAFYVAIKRGDTDAVRAALAAGADVHTLLGPGRLTPLQLASSTGRAAVVSVLLDAKARITEGPRDNGFAPLALAADGGHLDVVRVLADRTKPRPAVAAYALTSALMKGHAAVADLLLSRYRTPITFDTFVLALHRGDAATVRVLTDHGGDPNVRSAEVGDYGQTALHRAAKETAARVRALTACGGDVNARDDLGRTPLMLTVTMSYHDPAARAAFLMAVDRAAGDRAGLDDRQVVARGAADPAAADDIVAALLAAGADAGLVDHDGNGVLAHYEYEAARSRERPDPVLVEVLTMAGTPAPGPTGELFAAVRGRDVAAVRAALAAGADPNRIGPGRLTPLGTAAHDGSPELLQALIDGGADPNRRGQPHPPLIGAATSGNLPGVKVLLAAGADLHAQEPPTPGVPDEDDVRRNAFLAAEWNRKYHVVDYLRSLGAGRPKPVHWTPAKPGIAYLDDLEELHVKADVPAVAAALKRLTGEPIVPNAYGRSFTPGRRAFVVYRAKGLTCTRVEPLTDADWGDKALDALAGQLAIACGRPAFTARYNNTAGAASFTRFDPNGTRTVDYGWDYDTARAAVMAKEAAGEPIPDDLRRQVDDTDPDEPPADSVDRLRAAAEAEGFAFGLCWLAPVPGRPVDVEFLGRPAEAFEAVTYVGAV